MPIHIVEDVANLHLAQEISGTKGTLLNSDIKMQLSASCRTLIWERIGSLVTVRQGDSVVINYL